MWACEGAMFPNAGAQNGKMCSGGGSGSAVVFAFLLSSHKNTAALWLSTNVNCEPALALACLDWLASFNILLLLLFGCFLSPSLAWPSWSSVCMQLVILTIHVFVACSYFPSGLTDGAHQFASFLLSLVLVVV